MSDIHVDYADNAAWVAGLSRSDYRDDVLILAGDVAGTLGRLQDCLEAFAARFLRVLFVPGNHDLWVIREAVRMDSLEKFDRVVAVATASGASLQPFTAGPLAIVPLHGWYDYSFGEPDAQLQAVWMDYRACRWPEGWRTQDVAAHFLGLNATAPPAPARTVITFSHYLPRLDLMPPYVPPPHRLVYPVLGSATLDVQLRRLGSVLHVYGHSHVNREVRIDGVTYVNNAFAYPAETRIAAKRLRCVHAG
nr:metallophosphoesterase [Tahibacter caeni]